jgi:ABC-type multidrug transport system fused ATPase/permease subunit
LTPDRADALPLRQRQCVAYCYLAACAGVCGFAQAWGFSLLSERLSNRTRRAYLQALLATEVAFYDEASSGELVSRLASDIVLINLATGVKVGLLIQAAATFISGIVIGFIGGWRLTLVLIGFVPLLAGVGALTARWVAASASREAAAYGAAGSLAQEVFGAIRTVAAFTGEPAALRHYAAALEATLRMGITQKVVAGVGMGTSALSLCHCQRTALLTCLADAVQFISFTIYAVVLWYGTVLIRSGSMSGGACIAQKRTAAFVCCHAC